MRKSKNKWPQNETAQPTPSLQGHIRCWLRVLNLVNSGRGVSLPDIENITCFGGIVNTLLCLVHAEPFPAAYALVDVHRAALDALAVLCATPEHGATVLRALVAAIRLHTNNNQRRTHGDRQQDSSKHRNSFACVSTYPQKSL